MGGPPGGGSSSTVGGGSGRLGGQSAYVPFENRQLPWRPSADRIGSAEFDLPAVVVPEGKLGVILLVSGSDSKQCCAKNFERTLFRSPKVVQFCKKHVVPYRFDRSHGYGFELYTRHKLDTEKPSVLIVDPFGEVLYKTQKCTQPKDCYKSLVSASAVTRKRIAYSARAKKTLESSRKKIQDEDYRGALTTLERVQSEYLILPLRTELREDFQSIETAGSDRLEKARELEKEEDYDGAVKIYEGLSRSFSRLKTIYNQAREGLRRAVKLKKAAEKRARTTT